MLAAACGFGGADAVRTRLIAIGRAAGLGEGTCYIAGGIGIMVWGGAPVARLEGETAWLGDLRGPIAPIAVGRHVRGCAFSAAAVHEGTLVLACGRSGGRPLHLAWEDEGRRVVVCSRLAPLVATLTGAPAACLPRVADRITGLTPHDPHVALLDGIRHVGSSELFVLRERASAPVDVEVHALAPLGAGRPHDGSPDDVADELRACIDAAVARATRDARRVAVLGGGGIDSSVVLVSALAQARGAEERDVRALAVDAGGAGDDRPYMRALARELGLVVGHVGASSGAEHFASGVIIDLLPPWSHGFAWSNALMVEAKAQGADVVLGGNGGDELFDGDFSLFAARARRGDPIGAVIRALRMRAIYWAPGPVRRVHDLVVRPLLRDLVPARARARIRDVLRRARRQRATCDWYGPVLRDHVASAVPGGPAERTAEVLIAFAQDRARSELASGCERRDPLLDDDVVDFAMRIPREMLFHGDMRRGLLRHAFRGRLPDVVRLRQDKLLGTEGFQSLLNARGRALLRELSTQRMLAARGLVEPAAFRDHFERVLASDDPREWAPLWTPLVLEAFLREVEGAPPMRAAMLGGAAA